MPDQITGTGLQVKTLPEIVSDMVSGLQTIYGPDINVSQNSPDGQLVNIFAQSARDMRELLVSVYNSFSVENCFGVQLDQRVALNGLTRRAGTFTLIDVEVTTDRALNLQGLDGDINDPEGTGFTVSDDAGNQFILAASQVIAGAGVYSFSFRAKAVGAVETIPNTIVNITTVTLGVQAVNNPSIAVVNGENEESDVDLKIRHAKSFTLAAVSGSDSIQAAIEAIPDVTDCFVAENFTGGVVNTIPAHSIWAIVENGADLDIGTAIYAKKTPGCGMKGSVSVLVPRPNGTDFTAQFDRPIYQDLYIKFTMVPKVAGVSFDPDFIKTQLVALLKYKLAQSANIGDVVVALLVIAPLAVLSSVGLSPTGAPLSYVDILAPTSFQHKFVLDVTRIDITV